MNILLGIEAIACAFVKNFFALLCFIADSIKIKYYWPIIIRFLTT